jgi:polyferredoxin
MVNTNVTPEQSKDTGMALVLILLLIWVGGGHDGVVVAAIVVHVANMVMSKVFRPAAIVWFALSHLLGTVVSKVLLSIVFFGIVTPVGLWRRMLGKDSLRLRAFRVGHKSVMTQRNHTYTGRDIEHPY